MPSTASPLASARVSTKRSQGNRPAEQQHQRRGGESERDLAPAAHIRRVSGTPNSPWGRRISTATMIR